LSSFPAPGSPSPVPRSTLRPPRLPGDLCFTLQFFSWSPLSRPISCTRVLTRFVDCLRFFPYLVCCGSSESSPSRRHTRSHGVIPFSTTGPFVFSFLRTPGTFSLLKMRPSCVRLRPLQGFSLFRLCFLITPVLLGSALLIPRV